MEFSRAARLHLKQPTQPGIFWLIWPFASEPNCKQQGTPGAWIGQVPTKTPIYRLWNGFWTQNPRTCSFLTWRPAKPRTGMTVNLPSTHYHEFMSWLWFIMPLLNWRCLSSGREVHLSLTWETCMYPLKSHHLISRSPFGVFPSVCMCVCVCVCVSENGRLPWYMHILLRRTYFSSGLIQKFRGTLVFGQTWTVTMIRWRHPYLFWVLGPQSI